MIESIGDTSSVRAEPRRADRTQDDGREFKLPDDAEAPEREREARSERAEASRREDDERAPAQAGHADAAAERRDAGATERREGSPAARGGAGSDRAQEAAERSGQGRKQAAEEADEGEGRRSRPERGSKDVARSDAGKEAAGRRAEAAARAAKNQEAPKPAPGKQDAADAAKQAGRAAAEKNSRPTSGDQASRNAPVASLVRRAVRRLMEAEGGDGKQAGAPTSVALRPVQVPEGATPVTPPTAPGAVQPVLPPTPAAPTQALDPRVSEALQLLYETGRAETVVRVSDTEAGNLEARVRMEGSDLHVRLRADEALRHQRLLDALPQVRRELDREGLVDGRVHVSTWDGEASGEGGRGREAAEQGLDEHGEPAATAQPEQAREETGERTDERTRTGRLHVVV
ncbi:MAG: flagellar hook-length control protein FliK [Myxococcota bacterium]